MGLLHSDQAFFQKEEKYRCFFEDFSKLEKRRRGHLRWYIVVSIPRRKKFLILKVRFRPCVFCKAKRKSVFLNAVFFVLPWRIFFHFKNRSVSILCSEKNYPFQDRKPHLICFGQSCESCAESFVFQEITFGSTFSMFTSALRK